MKTLAWRFPTNVGRPTAIEDRVTDTSRPNSPVDWPRAAKCRRRPRAPRVRRPQRLGTGRRRENLLLLLLRRLPCLPFESPAHLAASAAAAAAVLHSPAR